MAMARVLKNNKGFSLIELLIASSLGLIALAVVTTVFLPGFQLASQRSLQLMLAQDTNDALLMLKRDILRAGYASGASSSFVISGATKTVYVKPPSSGKPTCIAFGYSDGADKTYQTYYLKDNKLNFISTDASIITTTTACQKGVSLLNEKQLKVTKFEIDEKVLSAGATTGQYLTIKLEVATLDNTVSAAKIIKVKTRNVN